ncbi:MAG TPA: hypothetical protein VEX88_13250, partial [Glaciibacter sp.]|nr:hypothetical protein [Glaciibacter sp.]
LLAPQLLGCENSTDLASVTQNSADRAVFVTRCCFGRMPVVDPAETHDPDKLNHRNAHVRA